MLPIALSCSGVVSSFFLSSFDESGSSSNPSGTGPPPRTIRPGLSKVLAYWGGTKAPSLSRFVCYLQGLAVPLPRIDSRMVLKVDSCRFPNYWQARSLLSKRSGPPSSRMPTLTHTITYRVRQIVNLLRGFLKEFP